MSDEGDYRTSYSSSRAKRKRKSSSQDRTRSYTSGGAAGQRKSDNPAGWSRTPDTRAGADRRSKW